MPAVQTTYSDNIAAGVAGQIVNVEPQNLISRTVETSGGIGFGVATNQGSADKGCVLAITGAAGAFTGVTVRERSIDANDADEFDQYVDARIAIKGVVWVTCATGCTAGDLVFVRPSNGDWQDSNANSGVQVENARWDTSATAGAVAQLRLG